MICTPFTKVTLVLLVIWLTTSFGFYGVSIWFPEYLRKLQSDSYSSEATIEANHFIRDYIFNYSLDNTNFEGCVFHNVRFTGIVLNHVLFTNCSFINSTFSDVRSSRSFFEQCDFRRVRFVDTDFYDFRFRDCAFHNSTTFLNRRTGCPIDFDVNFRLSDVFVENLFVQLAIIPGNIISSCVIDRIGRVRTLGISLSLKCEHSARVAVSGAVLCDHIPSHLQLRFHFRVERRRRCNHGILSSDTQKYGVRLPECGQPPRGAPGQPDLRPLHQHEPLSAHPDHRSSAAGRLPGIVALARDQGRAHVSALMHLRDRAGPPPTTMRSQSKCPQRLPPRSCKRTRSCSNQATSTNDLANDT